MWKLLKCPVEELNLAVVLTNGQSFRWRRRNGPVEELSEEFIGVMAHRVWLLKRKDPTHIAYQVLGRFDAEKCPPSTDLGSLRDYFQLDKVCVADLYSLWSGGLSSDNSSTASLKGKKRTTGVKLPKSGGKSSSTKSKKTTISPKSTISPDFSVISQYPGIRIVRQDPFECLFSFICSSNNHITRIAAMIDKLCTAYGRKISVKMDDNDSLVTSTTTNAESSMEDFYDFPTLDVLAENPVKVESTLRDLGFGYRAKYVAQTARLISEKEDGGNWVSNLRSVPYEEALKDLISLQGVGRKVADCVCLMSLDMDHVVPIDTHVWALSKQLFLPQLPAKPTFANNIPTAINAAWSEAFGPFAGWAQSVLFTSRLSQHKIDQTEKKKPKSTVKKELIKSK